MLRSSHSTAAQAQGQQHAHRLSIYHSHSHHLLRPIPQMALLVQWRLLPLCAALL